MAKRSLSPRAVEARLPRYWSRRISDEHRLVYKVDDGEIRIAGCRYHCGR
ncbi:type II toxin-antitoxin system YoeB family toxin [Parafrigoribacterium soli]